MKISERLLVIFPFLFWLGAAQASSAACQGSELVVKYLQANPQWKALEVADLVMDDQALWTRVQGDRCPGVTEVSMESGKQFTALALIRKDNHQLLEKVVLIPCDSTPVIELSPEAPVALPNVIGRVPPGRYVDRATGESTELKSDGVLYEQLEASAVILYLDDGKTRVIVDSE
jgi:hypothetical protein